MPAGPSPAPTPGQIGSPYITPYRTRRSGSQLPTRIYATLFTTTHGTIGTPAIFAILPTPRRNFPPRTTDSPPARIPPSGNIATTRPRESLSSTTRTVAGSARDRSSGNAFSDP